MFKNVFKIFKIYKIGCNSRPVVLGKRGCSSIRFRRLSTSTASQLRSLENHFMYQIISKNFTPFHVVNPVVDKVKNLEEFESLLCENYRINSGRSATDIVEVFKAVQDFSTLNQIAISDPRFDNLVDGLMDHCEKLTDVEILDLLNCLSAFPRCAYQDHNFHDVWSCLDDITKERIAGRSLDYLLQVADAWYHLGLAKLGDFIWALLDWAEIKAKRLSKDELVHMFFLTNACRRRSVPFNFEVALENYLEHLSPEEFGIVALGYFKSKTKIKTHRICLKMIEVVRENASTLDQITITAILKVLRFSKIGLLLDELDQMLETLTSEIGRLSPQCCLHMAIIGSSLNHFHENSMGKTAQRLVEIMHDVNEVRYKDIERIISAATMVNFRPKCTPDLFETVFEEIHTEKRLVEMVKFPKILPSILNYLSIVNMYSYELMDRVLNSDFINEVYNKSIGSIPRDIFLLDTSIDLECPNYKGNRLAPNIKYKLVKWIIEYIPSYDQYKKLTAYDKLFLDSFEHLKLVVGNAKFIRMDYVAPHFARADFIVCRDNRTGNFVEPAGFNGYFLGDLKYALWDANLTFYAIVVVGSNNTIRNTSLPVGMLVMKERHLKKLGYSPKMVVWNQFMPLSKGEKVKYIENILER